MSLNDDCRKSIREGSGIDKLVAEVAVTNQQLEVANKRSDELKSTLDCIAYKCLGVGERGTYVPSTMADEITSKITRLSQQLEAERANSEKLLTCIEASQKAIDNCPVLKEWSGGNPAKHLPSRVNYLCNLYQDSVRSTYLVGDALDATKRELEVEQAKVARLAAIAHRALNAFCGSAKSWNQMRDEVIVLQAPKSPKTSQQHLPPMELEETELVPGRCVRSSGHDGPCNGLPRKDCLLHLNQRPEAAASCKVAEEIATGLESFASRKFGVSTREAEVLRIMAAGIRARYLQSKPAPETVGDQPGVTQTATSAMSLREIAKELQKSLACNCDLDNWEPVPTTGHSHVCRIHKAAIERWMRSRPAPEVKP